MPTQRFGADGRRASALRTAVVQTLRPRAAGGEAGSGGGLRRERGERLVGEPRRALTLFRRVAEASVER